MNRRSGGTSRPPSRKRTAPPVRAAASNAADDAPSGLRSATVPWAALLLVAAVAIGVYANSLQGELFYDDTNAITRNDWVLNGDPLAIVTKASWWTQGRGHG